MQFPRYGIISLKITALILLILYPGIPAAIEFDSGADLRQNALLMSWPAGMDKYLFPTGSFGISETRMRLRSSVYSGRFVLNFALESRAGFISSNSGMLSIPKGIITRSFRRHWGHPCKVGTENGGELPGRITTTAISPWKIPSQACT